jgi:hypothetical protein
MTNEQCACLLPMTLRAAAQICDHERHCHRRARADRHPYAQALLASIPGGDFTPKREAAKAQLAAATDHVRRAAADYLGQCSA